MMGLLSLCLRNESLRRSETLLKNMGNLFLCIFGRNQLTLWVEIACGYEILVGFGGG